MAIIQLQLRQGPDTQRLQVTPLEGEMIYTTDTKMVFVGDGVTAGGNAVRVPMPSQGTSDNSDLAASTRFVQQAIANVTGVNLSDYARKSVDNNFTGANNNFTNSPTISAVIPLAENSSKVPTTQWVKSILGSSGNAALRDSANTFTSLNDFTVSPTAPTPAVNDSSAKVATTQFVKNVLNSNGLGLSTITITAGTGTAINYSAGTVTLPNGNVVNVTLGSLSLPSSGTYYITVDTNGVVSYSNIYPSGSAIRVIGTVSVSGGTITGLDLSGTDLSSYAKLSGATFSGPIQAPTPLLSVSDTTVATTAWVNSKIGGGVANDLVQESTSNSYQSATTQDFTLATTLVAPLAVADDSNKAASTSFVHDVVDAALGTGSSLSDYARKDGTTFTGIARGPLPTQLSSDDQLATTAWVRDVLDDVIVGGDIFPSLVARAGTRIIDYGTGRIRVSPSTACTITPGDIEIPANQTVWIYVDPTCGVNHYPFVNVATRPPTGKAFAYASTNATSITSITLLQPDTIIKGNVVVENDLTVNGTLTVAGPISLNAPNANTFVPYQAVGQELVTATWVRGVIDAVMPVGHVKMHWYQQAIITDAYGFIWALCNGQANPGGWTWVGPAPDFRDRFLMGAGSGAGAVIGGSNSTVLGYANMPIHDHAAAGGTEHAHAITTFSVRVDNDNITNQSQVIYGINNSGFHPSAAEYYDFNANSPSNATQYNSSNNNVSHREGSFTELAIHGNTDLRGGNAPFDNRPAFHTINFFIRVK